MPWAIQVPLQPNESLSSWLVRAALLQGCDPLVLTGAVWPGWRAWTVDVDRGLSADRLRVLSAVSGTHASRFVCASVRADAELLSGRSLARAEPWPWLLALGSRNRRRRGGQQFCPACLAEDAQPYFRRHWRFARHAACMQHRILLVDRCHFCDVPVAFHHLLAEDKHLALCGRCRGDVRHAECVPAPSELLAFQSTADGVLAAGVGSIWGCSVGVPQWFGTARFLINAMRRARRQKRSRLTAAIRSVGVDMLDRAIPLTGLPLEMLPVADRCMLLAMAHQLMQVELSTWVAVLVENGVTVSGLTGGDRRLPRPVQVVVARLPSGRTTVRRSVCSARTGPRSETAVRGVWARLQRRSRMSGA